ncbi:putative leucine-rich repeat protein (LRRP) [Trypanosoma grayi]|uniref:putative leucine-rich repeat protein (LRRP) n=1 Tax=Trypanosoma grayi TaxID=71804 RepID=UPI0004F4A4BC|nr:putative leucine-rich repeat protein (LRRP) [Trypanosoma grayi]KEG07265.1 putative leucine-rich repeat protein (LRRP) [Trypanosoma grayi]
MHGVSSQHIINWDVVLAYSWRPAPLALAGASPWLRRRMEQLDWISLVSKKIPAHYPELRESSATATLILGDGNLFRESVAIPRQYRRRLEPGQNHHSALLLDQLWRQGSLNNTDTQTAACLRGITNDVLVVEDMSCTCHVFLANNAAPPTPHLLYWLARPRRGEDRQWAVKHRMPLAIDEMVAYPNTSEEDVKHLNSDVEGSRIVTRARGLALHLTEHHLPWLAKALVSELPNLQELYFSLDEGMLQPPREVWWWIVSMLAGKSNLRVLCLSRRPAPLLGASRMAFSDEVVLAPYVEEIEPGRGAESALGRTHNSPRRTVGCTAIHNAEAWNHSCGNDFLAVKGPCATSLGAAISSHDNCGSSALHEQNCGAPRLLDSVDVRGLQHLTSLEVLYICPSAMESLPFLAHTTKLREVYLLSNTKLHTLGARDLEHLPALEVLWLECTSVRQLSGLQCSTTLRELHVVLDPSFNTSSLEGIECIPTLEVLHLERVSVDALAFIGHSTSLRELIVQACRMPSKKALHGVERAPLEHVSFAYTDGLRDADFLATCKTVRQLLLTRCNGIGTTSIAGLGVLPRLEVLALEFTRVDSIIEFTGSQSLRHLRLNGCKRVRKGSISGLDGCETLQYLCLQNTNVISVEALNTSRSLVELDLSHCKHLEQQGIEGLVSIPVLKILRMSHTPITSISFLKNITSLEELYIDHCPNITNEGLQGIEENPTLRTLSLMSSQANEIGFLGGSRRLEVLHVASMERLRTPGIRGVERCSRLRHLNMAFCGVDSVTCLANGCFSLEYLNLRGCQRLTSEGLKGLETLPTLTDLILDDLDLVSDINSLAACSSLRHLSAARCTSLTFHGVQSLLARARPIVLHL